MKSQITVFFFPSDRELKYGMLAETSLYRQ